MRVVVVGASCSGKTTFARRLAAARGIPHIELDALYWQPNWTPTPIEQLRVEVGRLVGAEDWVLDGNYSKLRDLTWSRATDIVWLNLPFVTVFRRALTRTLRRVITKERLFGRNLETWSLVLFNRDSILWWVIRTHGENKRNYRQLFSEGQFPHVKVHEVRSESDAGELLARLSGEG